MDDELDINDTIRSTAHNGGMLDIKMRPERRNTVKVLLFLDIGGSMDAHVKILKLFASRTGFKHLRVFTFTISFTSRFGKITETHGREVAYPEILNKYSGDYKVVFVGDATMAP